jgi:hypothetical protein
MRRSFDLWKSKGQSPSKACHSRGDTTLEKSKQAASAPLAYCTTLRVLQIYAAVQNHPSLANRKLRPLPCQVASPHLAVQAYTRTCIRYPTEDPISRRWPAALADAAGATAAAFRSSAMAADRSISCGARESRSSRFTRPVSAVSTDASVALAARITAAVPTDPTKVKVPDASATRARME